MRIAVLLRYQVGYIILGLGYNVVSLIMKASGGKALASTNATAGIAAMLVFSLFLIPGFLKHYKSYRILMGIAALIFCYSGVVVHLLNYARLELYYAPAAWMLAIFINLFGVVLNAVAASGMFLMHGEAPLHAGSGRQNRHHG